MAPPCPVCRNPSPEQFLTVGEKDYWRCDVCQARFLDPKHYLSPQAERAEYELHQNELDDPGYRKFLAKLVDPLLGKLAPSKKGLDYGCGPGPALVEMMRDAGHNMVLYDSFFHPDPAPLSQTFDFITCTEVAEHFHNPAQEFERFDTLLTCGGWLAIMTCFQTNDEKFEKWRYRNDSTHVVFYREATLCWVAKQRGWRLEVPVKDVALMQKPRPH